jgi:serine/threonine protein kinase
MKKKLYKGGADLLGEGSYGCVYKKDNNIIKILFDNEKFIKEVMTTLLINKIDKTITSARIEDIKSFKISEIKDKQLLNDLEKCELLSDKYIDAKNIYEIIYNIKYFGTDLYEITKKDIISLDKILALSLRLYEALELYNNFRVLHSDIKPDNILYLKESDIIIFIDFGLLKTYDEILFDVKTLKHTYFYFPPEFKLIMSLQNDEDYEVFFDNFLLNLDKRQNKSNILLENYKDYYKDLRNVYNKYYKLYNNYLKELYNDDDIYKKKIINKIFNDNHKDKMDLYGLSMSMYEIIMLYLEYNKTLIEDSDFVLDFIKNIILPSINFDIDKRITVRETINNFKKLNHKNKDINNILKQKSLKETIDTLNNEDSILNKPMNNITNIDNCIKNMRVNLLKIAKEKNIKYRHKMNKEELCKNIEITK